MQLLLPFSTVSRPGLVAYQGADGVRVQGEPLPHGLRVLWVGDRPVKRPFEIRFSANFKPRLEPV